MTPQERGRAKMLMLWLGMFAIVMLFGAFSSAIIVRQSDSNWFKFPIPPVFTQSTVVLLVSSVTMFLGVFLTRRGQKWPATLFIFLTFVLGVVFTVMQFEGWKALIRQDIYFADPRTNNVSGSFFYVLTAMHLLHLLGGLIAMLVTSIRSAAGKYKPDSYLGLKLSSIYWHFLDGLWLYLFLFLRYSDQLF